jgi:hypothetical protein
MDDDRVDNLTGVSHEDSTPWGTGLAVAAFVAAFTAGAIVVLSLGMTRVHPLVSIGLNVIAVGGLAPTLWGWRGKPVRRWFVLGAAAGVVIGWIAMLALTLR